MEELYEAKEGILYELYRFEANEMWTGPPGGFVRNKGNKQWIWLVMNTANRQIIACHVGGNRTHENSLIKSLNCSKQMRCFLLTFGTGTTCWTVKSMGHQGKKKGTPII